jgi:hypothetical protein
MKTQLLFVHEIVLKARLERISARIWQSGRLSQVATIPGLAQIEISEIGGVGTQLLGSLSRGIDVNSQDANATSFHLASSPLSRQLFSP